MKIETITNLKEKKFFKKAHRLKRLRYNFPLLFEHLIGQCNFIFAFGNLGVGKSTLLASLVHLLYLRAPIHGNSNNRDGKVMLLDWVEKLRDQEFPIRSRIGEILEIDVKTKWITSIENLKKITFLEMSGEDLTIEIDIRKIRLGISNEGKDMLINSASDNDHLPLNVRLRNYLKLSKIFLLITDVESAREDDQLMFQFFDYLRESGIRKPAAALIITKWDMVGNFQTVESFVREKMPQTLRHFESDYLAEKRIFPFSVGEVDSTKIKNLNLEYSKEIITWILENLTV